MSYQEKLRSPKWRIKRKGILRRDKYICKDCLKGETHTFSFGSKSSVLVRVNDAYYIGSDSIWDEPQYTLLQFIKKIKPKPFVSYKIDGYPGYIFINDDGYIIISTVPKTINICNMVQRNYMITHVEHKYPNLYLIYDKKIDPGELLDTKRFSDLEIIDCSNWNRRDIKECTYQLHVHHKYYVLGNDPWDYDNQALVTLCHECHYERHINQDIPVYGIECGGRKVIPYYHICDRCGGEGHFPQWEHVQDGVCFKCWGTGYYDSYSYPPYQGFKNFVKHLNFDNTARISKLPKEYLNTITRVEIISTDLDGRGEELFALINCVDFCHVIIKLDESCLANVGDVLSKESLVVNVLNENDNYFITISGAVLDSKDEECNLLSTEFK